LRDINGLSFATSGSSSGMMPSTMHQPELYQLRKHVKASDDISHAPEFPHIVVCNAAQWNNGSHAVSKYTVRQTATPHDHRD
jgi:hypothetical protein